MINRKVLYQGNDFRIYVLADHADHFDFTSQEFYNNDSKYYDLISINRPRHESIYIHKMCMFINAYAEVYWGTSNYVQGNPSVTYKMLEIPLLIPEWDHSDFYYTSRSITEGFVKRNSRLYTRHTRHGDDKTPSNVVWALLQRLNITRFMLTTRWDRLMPQEELFVQKLKGDDVKMIGPNAQYSRTQLEDWCNAINDLERY